MKAGDLRPVLTQAIAASQPLARDAKVAIDAELDGNSSMVLMDASRLALVFENLLANAIQHSRGGDRVVVKASCNGWTCWSAIRGRASVRTICRAFFSRSTPAAAAGPDSAFRSSSASWTSTVAS